MSRELARTQRELSATPKTPLVILADHSLSMASLIPELEISAYEELKRALGIALKGRNDWTLYAFSGEVTRCDRPESIPAPDATTYLAPALRTAQQHDPDALLVVTDGYL